MRGSCNAWHWPLPAVPEEHAATTPIRDLPINAYYPELVYCAVNPKNGDLAVVTELFGSDPGALMIFKDGSGTQTDYQTSKMFYHAFVTYDKSRNASGPKPETQSFNLRRSSISGHLANAKSYCRVSFSHEECAVGRNSRGDGWVSAAKRRSLRFRTCLLNGDDTAAGFSE